MGLILSFLYDIYAYLTGNRRRDYELVEHDGAAPSPTLSKTHKACRSCNPTKLTPYQSKIDNLKADQIVYVTLNTRPILLILCVLN